MNKNIPLNDVNIELDKYRENLEYKNLPCIYSTKHLALLLDIDHKVIVDLIKNSKKYYHEFYLNKKNGKRRLIMAPDDILKSIQKSIDLNILKNVPLETTCIGFVKGRSIKDNAKVHSQKKYIMSIDLYRFFDSINVKRVYGMFRWLGYEKNISYSLAQLCTTNLTASYIDEIKQDEYQPNEFDLTYVRRLPQGAPTSPGIANIIASKLDRRLGALCVEIGASYSRYADDITISSNKNVLPSLDFIEMIIKEEGFFLNTNKTRYLKAGNKQLVTGLTITNGVHVPRKIKDEIKNHLYYCKKYGVVEHLSYLKKQINFEKYHYKEWLLGKIFYIKSIEPNVGNQLLKEFNKINWLEMYNE